MILSGVFAPIPTPFDEDDRVDTRRLRAALERWAAGPLDGFVVLGSTGEAVFLDDFEADRVIVAAREAIPRDRAFIVGTGRESTQAAIKAAKGTSSQLNSGKLCVASSVKLTACNV